MSNFTPTPEQTAIVAFAKTSDKSLLISALAGSSKTTTLELIAKALPSTPILSLAFNRKIADEMKTRLPGNVLSQTLNSLGHRVWSDTINKRKLLIDTKKSFNLLSAAIEARSRKRRDIDFADVLKSISFAKLRGYIPDHKFPDTARLLDSDAFFASLDEEPSGDHCDLVNTVIEESIRLGFEGTLDFDDQIFLPALFAGRFPSFPLVMLDEAQDSSEMNRIMLIKLVKQRLIAVGDECQSVYLFRGAASNAMRKLKETFNMEELGLSISFRCPRLVVEEARFRAPHMQYAEWAPEGVVTRLGSEWTCDQIQDESAIICRNNAPLLKLALRLIRAGRGVKLVGTELGPQLVKALKKLGPPELTQAMTLEAIDTWAAERLRKSRAKAATQDKTECLRVFAGYGQTLGEAIAYAENLFASAGPINLMSIHKAKGLEFDTVYFLDDWRIPSPWADGPEELLQEQNARYVGITRAKKALFYIDLDKPHEP